MTASNVLTLLVAAVLATSGCANGRNEDAVVADTKPMRAS
jgi:hypothetical protein